jgi:hypothetical protein
MIFNRLHHSLEESRNFSIDPKPLVAPIGFEWKNKNKKPSCCIIEENIDLGIVIPRLIY